MASDFCRYRCMLVKEDTVPYELDKVKSSADVFEVIRTLGYERCAEEVVGLFTMDSQGGIIGFHEISHGTINESIVTPRDVFKRAILENAAGIIIFHNHPSGNLEPSPIDEEMTKALKEAGKIIGIKLLDHVIVSHEGFVSLHSRGII